MLVKAHDFSRNSTSQGSLPTKEFYKHTIFAPGRDTGYAPVTFPGVTESITSDEDVDLTQQWIEKTSAAILVPASILKTQRR